jgi:hypothetical protein
MLAEVGFPSGDLIDGDGVEETIDTSVDDGDLNLRRKGLILALLCSVMSECVSFHRPENIRTEQLSQTGPTGEEEAGRGIEIGTKLGEGGDFTVLSEVEL